MGPSIVEPPERLLEEEEPEAFEEQPVEEADREALPLEEIEEAPEARRSARSKCVQGLHA